MKHLQAFALVLLLVISACTPLDQVQISTSDQRLKEFSTSEQLTAFLKEHQDQQGGNYGGPFMMAARDAVENEGSGAPVASPTAQKSADSNAGRSYSQTNVQEEGVDEADIVKNDDRYIYTLTQNKLVIVDAYPPTTAKIVTTLELAGNARDLFINKNRLVVFTDLYPQYYALGGVTRGMMEDTDVASSPPSSGSGEGEIGAASKIAMPEIWPPQPYQPPRTGVLIYDTTNKEDPELVANYTVEGNYLQSRMIGDYVYVIAQNNAYYGGGPMPLPAIKAEDQLIMESPVYYFDNWEPQINFNSIASFNVQDVEDVNLQTFMLGYANTLYVSDKNLYIAYQKQIPYAYYEQDQKSRFTEIIIPLLPNDLQQTMYGLLASEEDFNLVQQRMYEALETYYNKLDAEERQELQTKIDKALQEYEFKLQEERMKTVIHRLSLQEGIVKYEDKGEVKGNLLNQFSLDEHEKYLRVATTVDFWGSQGSQSYNNVYILNDNLKVVGKLENLAQTERIYSTRFIGDRLYMVTFRQIDPLFVIDLSDVEAPKVLGQLKIPGFSNYLHPYDENHIIGLGQDTVEEQGRTTTGGLKIALFDVTDVNNPKEEAKLIIGGQGTSSEAFYDHKAFLLDKERNFVIFPVSEVKNGNWEHVWQGAYVLRVRPDVGFTVQGKETHATYDPAKLYDTYSTQVRRALYIGDVLYTLSPKKIKMNDLRDLQVEHKTITLPYKDEVYGPIMY